MKQPPGLIETLKLENHRSERRPNDLKVPLTKQRKFDHFIEFSLANIWNSLPANTKEPCLPHTFKERTKKHLIKAYDNIMPCTTPNCPSCLFSRPFKTK